MTLRPVEDTFISASCARRRPGGGGGVGDGGHFGVDWTSMHCTRVTMLKLSFNGRQCQKLSLSLSLAFLSFPLEQSMLICLFRYGFAKISFYFQRSVDWFELSQITWISNSRYRTLSELISCHVSSSNSTSSVEFYYGFSVRFVVRFWPFLCLFYRRVFW